MHVRAYRDGCVDYLCCMCLYVPEWRLQTSLGQKAVLKTLEEHEQRGLVGEKDWRKCYTIVTNQNHFSRPPCTGEAIVCVHVHSVLFE
jgi:hypothetical protein